MKAYRKLVLPLTTVWLLLCTAPCSIYFATPSEEDKAVQLVALERVPPDEADGIAGLKPSGIFVGDFEALYAIKQVYPEYTVRSLYFRHRSTGYLYRHPHGGFENDLEPFMIPGSYEANTTTCSECDDVGRSFVYIALEDRLVSLVFNARVFSQRGSLNPYSVDGPCTYPDYRTKWDEADRSLYHARMVFRCEEWNESGSHTITRIRFHDTHLDLEEFSASDAPTEVWEEWNSKELALESEPGEEDTNVPYEGGFHPARPLRVSRAQVMADGGLRMRDRPGLHGGVVTLIPDGTQVEVLEAVSSSDDILAGWHGRWSKIRHDDRVGYVFDAYLGEGKSLPPIAHTETGKTATVIAARDNCEHDRCVLETRSSPDGPVVSRIHTMRAGMNVELFQAMDWFDRESFYRIYRDEWRSDRRTTLYRFPLDDYTSLYSAGPGEIYLVERLCEDDSFQCVVRIEGAHFLFDANDRVFRRFALQEEFRRWFISYGQAERCSVSMSFDQETSVIESAGFLVRPGDGDLVIQLEHKSVLLPARCF